MTINEHAEVFYRKPVKQYEGPDDWEGLDVAYRIAMTYDDEPNSLTARLTHLAAEEHADQLEAILIGAWMGDASDHSSESVVKELIRHRQKFKGLKAIFLGDIIVEENEISWIEQSNVSPLLEAYPLLEVFRVRGGNSLKFSAIRHEALQQLIIEAGGLNRSVIREICHCDFPKLNHLELWLGEGGYGWDGGVEDLQPILAGARFSALTYLGLRNSEIADDIAAVVVNAPIVRRLETLDLSNGTLTDIGGQALLNLPSDIPLKELNLTRHYMTEAMADRLTAKLRCNVVTDDGQDPDSEWRSVLVSE